MIYGCSGNRGRAVMLEKEFNTLTICTEWFSRRLYSNAINFAPFNFRSQQKIIKQRDSNFSLQSTSVLHFTEEPNLGSRFSTLSKYIMSKELDFATSKIHILSTTKNGNYGTSHLSPPSFRQHKAGPIIRRIFTLHRQLRQL